MSEAATLALYGAGFVATGLPPAWLTFSQCQRAMDPAPLSGCKRHVAAAIIWDLLLAYTAGAAVFVTQRFASFGLSGRFDQATSLSQQGAFLIVVAVLAGGTGVAARTAGERLSPARERARGSFDTALLVLKSKDSPKLRALEQLGAVRGEWLTAYAAAAAQHLSKMPIKRLQDQVELYLRARALSGRVGAKATGQPAPVDVNTLCHDLTSMTGEQGYSKQLRVEVLVMTLLENHGRRRVDALVEEAKRPPPVKR